METVDQSTNNTKIQKDKNESSILRCQGSFALLRCFGKKIHIFLHHYPDLPSHPPSSRLVTNGSLIKATSFLKILPNSTFIQHFPDQQPQHCETQRFPDQKLSSSIFPCRCLSCIDNIFTYLYYIYAILDHTNHTFSESS